MQASPTQVRRFENICANAANINTPRLSTLNCIASTPVTDKRIYLLHFIVDTRQQKTDTNLQFQ